MSNVAEVTRRTFVERVLQAKRPVVVDFYADWCMPCRRMSPTIERLATELAGEVDFVKLDIERAPDIAAAYRISSIPSFLRFEDGHPVFASVGVRPGRVLSQELHLPTRRRTRLLPPKDHVRSFPRLLRRRVG